MSTPYNILYSVMREYGAETARAKKMYSKLMKTFTGDPSQRELFAWVWSFSKLSGREVQGVYKPEEKKLKWGLIGQPTSALGWLTDYLKQSKVEEEVFVHTHPRITETPSVVDVHALRGKIQMVIGPKGLSVVYLPRGKIYTEKSVTALWLYKEEREELWRVAERQKLLEYLNEPQSIVELGEEKKERHRLQSIEYLKDIVGKEFYFEIPFTEEEKRRAEQTVKIFRETGMISGLLKSRTRQLIKHWLEVPRLQALGTGIQGVPPIPDPYEKFQRGTGEEIKVQVIQIKGHIKALNILKAYRDEKLGLGVGLVFAICPRCSQMKKPSPRLNFLIQFSSTHVYDGSEDSLDYFRTVLFNILCPSCKGDVLYPFLEESY